MSRLARRVVQFTAVLLLVGSLGACASDSTAPDAVAETGGAMKLCETQGSSKAC
jgi:hypothetical protein